jgi:hypothetical protein
MEKADPKDVRFATLAMEKGFINLDQFTEAMRVQVMEDIAGVKHRRIGEILLEIEYISLSEISEVLAEMGIPN